VRNEKDMAIVESLLSDRDGGTIPHMTKSNEEEPRERGNNKQEGVKKRRIEHLSPSLLVQHHGGNSLKPSAESAPKQCPSFGVAGTS
jgi:hypothetical protein